MMKTLLIIVLRVSILIFPCIYFLSCGKKDIANNSASIKPKPKASFEYTLKSMAGNLPDTVFFNNTSTDAISYVWTFDDGNTSVLQNPINIYKAAKTFNVKLVVTGSNGMMDSITKAITITLDKPKPDFIFNVINNGLLPTRVAFTNTSLRADSVLWDFDDGNTSHVANPQNDYRVSKNYSVKMVAFNSAGKDSVIKQVLITIDKPTAGFNFVIPSGGGDLPCKVVFTNTSKNAESYNWYLGDGQTSTLESPENSYTKSGTYSIKLVVTNSSGKDSFSRQVTILPLNYSVRVFLITPSDKSFNQAYYDILKATAIDIQAWYKLQLNDKTFTLTSQVIDTLRGLHPYSWYNSDNGSAISGTDPRFYGYYNTLYEISKLNIAGRNLSYTYMYYVAAPGGGAGGLGQAALGDQDLDGLLSEKNSVIKRWVGGSAHEWGHAFGLVHPDNQLANAIMWTGYTIYPNCILQQNDKDVLNNSKFFK